MDEYEDDVYYCFKCHRAMDRYETRRFIVICMDNRELGHHPVCDACYWGDIDTEDE